MSNFKLKYEDTIKTGNTLYNEKPIVINRDLAEILGDVELAIIIQEIHYWININRQNAENNLSNIVTYYDECFWCFRTYEDWLLDFPWSSLRTLKRKFKKLEEINLLISNNFNKLNLDKTKWYTINYDKLNELEKQFKQRKQEKLKQKEYRKQKQKEYRNNSKNKQNNVDNYVDNSKNNVETMLKNNNQHSNLLQISESAKMAQSRECQNGTTESAKMALPIQENNIQEINYIQEINNVSLSVVEEPKKEITDGQTDYTQNSNNNFKIEFDNCDNEIKKTVVHIANELLQQKTTTVSNKKINVNNLILKLKEMGKQTINKLIDYVVKKFEISNNDNIKNKVKYISAIFTNAILEKSYLLDDAKREVEQNSNNNNYYDKPRNKFLNYNQEPLKNEICRMLELKSLYEGIIDFSGYKNLQEYQLRIKEYNDMENNDF